MAKLSFLERAKHYLVSLRLAGLLTYPTHQPSQWFVLSLEFSVLCVEFSVNSNS